MSLLPANVLAHILTFADTATFYVLSQCCQLLRQLAQQSDIVQKRCQNLSLPHGVYRNLASGALESWFNGFLHGKTEMRSRGLRKFAHWAKDRMHGPERWFYQDGRVWGMDWKDGVRDGLEFMINPEGRFLTLIEWKNDRRNGLSCIFNEHTLELESYCEWQNGQKHGLEQLVESGVVVMQNLWRAGESVGQSFTCYPDGQLRDFGHYGKEGLLSGWRFVFYNLGVEVPLLLQRRLYYVGGEKHGTDIQYFTSGNLQSYRKYKMGKLDGAVRQWDAAGLLREEGWWSDGLPVGLHRTWHKNGGLCQLTGYAAGKQHGTSQTLYKNGGIAWLCHWENGGKQGLEIRYYPDGAEWHSTYWKNNQKDGKEVEWINGKIMAELLWRRGQLHGEIRHFYEGGQKRSSGCWENGMQIGLHEEWYPSGQLRSQKNWKEGQQFGLSKSWYESGQLEKKTIWQADEKWGIQKHYYANGQLASQTRWIMGQKSGYEISWQADGRLALFLPYVDSVLHGIGWNAEQPSLLYFWNDLTVCREDMVKLLEGFYLIHPHSDDVLIFHSDSRQAELDAEEPTLEIDAVVDDNYRQTEIQVDSIPLADFEE